MTDLYSKNCKTLIKEIEDTNTWIGLINITKIAIVPKAIYKFSATIIKTANTYATELE